MKLLNPSLMIAFALAAIATADTSAADVQRPDIVTLTKAVFLDPQGRLQAGPGRYRKVREDRSGAYYTADAAQGGGALVGAYRAKITPSPAKGVIIPPLKKARYLLVLADGSTVCGADENFTRMICTQTDALTGERQAR